MELRGKFEYYTGDIKHKGEFNIYQGKNGAIFLLMGKKYVALTKQQIDDLCINCYELQDFNHDDFMRCYSKETIAVSDEDIKQWAEKVQPIRGGYLSDYIYAAKAMKNGWIKKATV